MWLLLSIVINENTDKSSCYKPHWPHQSPMGGSYNMTNIPTNSFQFAFKPQSLLFCPELQRRNFLLLSLIFHIGRNLQGQGQRHVSEMSSNFESRKPKNIFAYFSTQIELFYLVFSFSQHMASNTKMRLRMDIAKWKWSHNNQCSDVLTTLTTLELLLNLLPLKKHEQRLFHTFKTSAKFIRSQKFWSITLPIPSAFS